VSQRSPAPTVGRAIFARHVDCSNGQLVHQTVQCAPDSVWCANQSRGATVGYARLRRRSRTGLSTDLSSGALDCLVRHSTEGKIGLPSWSLTAPSCLGAIKGTPRRMDVALILVAFLVCWQKSSKTGRLKGKCALGQFL
jgi:hypothetical protein